MVGFLDELESLQTEVRSACLRELPAANHNVNAGQLYPGCRGTLRKRGLPAQSSRPLPPSRQRQTSYILSEPTGMMVEIACL
jgi:hypothetical protein